MRRVQLIPIGAARSQSLPVITTASLPVATQGLAYSTTLTESGGVAPFTWSKTGTLDSGLTLAPTTGVISGIPATPATNSLTFTVTDSIGKQGNATLPLTVVVSNAPTIATTSPLPNGTVGVAYSVTFAASNGSPPYSWSIVSGFTPSGGGANDGLTLSAAGVLSGTPVVAVTGGVMVIKVTDSAANSSQGSFAFTAAVTIPSVVTNVVATALAGTPAAVSLTFTAPANTGGSPITGYKLTASSGATQTTSGTATTVVFNTALTNGTPYSFTVAAINAVGQGPTSASSNVVTPTIAPLAFLSTSPLPTAFLNVPYSYQMLGQGGVPPYQFLPAPATGTPLPMTIAGLMSGTPGSVGTFSFLLTLKDSVPTLTANTTFQLIVASSASSPVAPTNIRMLLQGQAAAGSGGGTGIVPTAPNQMTVGWAASQGTILQQLSMTAGTMAASHTYYGFAAAVFAADFGIPVGGTITKSPSGSATIRGFAVDGLVSDSAGRFTTLALNGAPSNLVFSINFVDATGVSQTLSSTNASQVLAYGAVGNRWVWINPAYGLFAPGSTYLIAEQGSNPIASYNVYRSTNGGAYAKIGNTAALSYTDLAATLCVNGTQGATPPYYVANTYLYKITAVDTQGIESPQSESQSFDMYKDGTFNWAGDYSYPNPPTGITIDYNNVGQQQGLNACVKVSVNSGFAGWQPYSGNLVTLWNMWGGAFNYLYFDLKPAAAGQTWGLNPLRVGDIPIYNSQGQQISFNVADYGPAPVAGVWATYKIPLAVMLNDFGPTGAGPATYQHAIYKFAIQDTTGSSSRIWYADNIRYSPT